MEQFKSAVVYGKSVKHQPQRVGLAHELEDEDVGKSHPSTPSSKLVSRKEECMSMISCRILFSSFHFSVVILNNGWNERAKANITNPSDHYQAMINIPKAQHHGGQSGGWVRDSALPVRVQSKDVIFLTCPQKPQSLAFQCSDTGQSSISAQKPGSEYRLCYMIFLFRKVFLLDDRRQTTDRDKSRGWTAAMRRH